MRFRCVDPHMSRRPCSWVLLGTTQYRPEDDNNNQTGPSTHSSTGIPTQHGNARRYLGKARVFRRDKIKRKRCDLFDTSDGHVLHTHNKQSPQPNSTDNHKATQQHTMIPRKKKGNRRNRCRRRYRLPTPTPPPPPPPPTVMLCLARKSTKS